MVLEVSRGIENLGFRPWPFRTFFRERGLLGIEMAVVELRWELLGVGWRQKIGTSLIPVEQRNMQKRRSCRFLCVGPIVVSVEKRRRLRGGRRRT